MNIGVHQASVLSPLLFIFVLEALSKEFRSGVPWELLYADNLVIVTESLDKCINRLKVWKSGMESKDLHVPSSWFVVLDWESYEILVLFLVLSVAVVFEPILFFALYVLCGYIKNAARADPRYICPRCCDTDGRITDEVVVDNTKMNVVHSFCYLGDIIIMYRRWV